MKALKKNKKGFTLVEVIVVLLIIGILLAITIPSIMGYVGKAKDAQYIAEGRNGYVAAQTILADKTAGLTIPADAADKTALKTQIEAAITPASVGKELGEIAENDNTTTVGSTIKTIKCDVAVGANAVTLTGCSIQTIGTGNTASSKWVNFVAGTSAAAPSVSVDPKPTYTAAP